MIILEWTECGTVRIVVYFDYQCFHHGIIMTNVPGYGMRCDDEDSF